MTFNTVATSTLIDPHSPVSLHPEWTSFTNANYIRAMLVDQQGDLWTAGSGGVVHWDVDTGMYTKYTTEHGLASNYVRSIAQTADGVLWFGTCWGGLSYFDGKNWKSFTTEDGLLSNCIVSMAVTPDGMLWVGTYGGVNRYDGESWTSYTSRTNENAPYRADVLTVAMDGTLWVGGHDDGGLRQFDGEKWLDFSQNMPDKSVTAIAFTTDGTMWVGGKDILSSYHNGFWKTHPITNPNQSTCVSTITVTQTGTVWVGFSLYELEYEKREGFPKKKGTIPGCFPIGWGCLDRCQYTGWIG